MTRLPEINFSGPIEAGVFSLVSLTVGRLPEINFSGPIEALIGTAMPYLLSRLPEINFSGPIEASVKPCITDSRTNNFRRLISPAPLKRRIRMKGIPKCVNTSGD